jgi:hypothetical protein
MPRDEPPIELCFADLFDNLGTDAIGYSSRSAQLSGHMICIEGYLAHVHSHGPAPAALMLVDQPGLCPDCSPTPAAVITVMRSEPAPGLHAEAPVRVEGMLDFGFRIDEGVASFIRIEHASIMPVIV